MWVIYDYDCRLGCGASSRVSAGFVSQSWVRLMLVVEQEEATTWMLWRRTRAQGRVS